MKPAQSKAADDLRMSGDEFDNIMRKALQVHPEEAPKSKKAVKAKTKTAPKKAK